MGRCTNFCCDLLKEFIKVSENALRRFQTHFEGNLGDQMETIPVLQRLHEWGVTVDAYLSVWMPESKRLNPAVLSRVKKYVDKIYNKVGQTPTDQVRHMLVERNYDVAIIAPGPTVNEITYCIPNPANGGNVSMVWFGVSITKVAWKHTYQKHKHCLKMVAVREEISYESATSMLEPEEEYEHDTKLMLSGDFSFSYIPDQTQVVKFRNKFLSQLAPLIDSKKDWVVIFSRENNFGGLGGIKVKDGKVIVQTLDHHVQNHDIENVVFATSSSLEDAAHMKNIRNAHKIPGSRMISLDT